MQRLEDYDYNLPTELIAQQPLEDRAASRLLVLSRRTGEIQHRMFRDLVELVKPDDLLVLNNTRVTARRLLGRKSTGASVEFLLLRAVSDDTFEVLARPGKRLQLGSRVDFGAVAATVLEDLEEGRKRVRFEGNVHALPALGQIPLPPYIHESLSEEERYQTVYASRPGSAAAPTAGLHFTPDLLRSVQEKGVTLAYVTLDVGLDTFRPVTASLLSEHKMHGEVCEVPAATAEAVNRCKGRIIAVGTTTVRTLESFATGRGQIEPGRKSTSLFIRPGYEFRVVDAMFTNFHMPRTTMLVMLSALAGRDAVMNAYKEAVAERYRFLSFGDSMFII